MEVVLNHCKCVVAFEDTDTLPFFSRDSKPTQDMKLRVIGKDEERVIVDLDTAIWLRDQDYTWVREGKGIAGVKLQTGESKAEPLEDFLEKLKVM